MFENFSESARRAIFFARYEASQYGCPYIEPEHLLFGIFRADQKLTDKVIKNTTTDVIRKEIEQRSNIRPATSTSVDLPLGNASKRVLAYAAEESERLSHRHIGPKHLLLGVLREEQSFAAEILRKHGLRIDTVRAQVAEPDIVPIVSPRLDGSMVTITSNPSGADIEIDDKFIGNTPAEVPLLAREWTVRISKKGYQLWERKLLVLPQGKQNIAVDLAKQE